MTEVTVTDYETREVQRQLYECDQCGKRGDSDVMNTAGFFDGIPNHTARLSDESVATKHLCDECSGVATALKVREKRQHVKERWESFAKTVNKTIPIASVLGSFSLGMLLLLVAGQIRIEGATGVIIEQGIASLMILFWGLGLWTIAVVIAFGD